LCNSVVSLFDIASPSTSIANIFNAGTNQSKGILGSHPNVLCKTCHPPRHPIDACSNPY